MKNTPARLAIVVTVVLLALAGTSACGERDQTTQYKDGKYRGKPDGRPWDGQPPGYVQGEWTRGDHSGWERQLRARNSAQNENSRIGR
jgi:hypothetical protein